MPITVVRTGCAQYTIKNSGSGLTYEVTISNINGDYTQSWSIVDTADVLINFTIDGIYVFTASIGSLFVVFNIPISAGGIGFRTVTFDQSSIYVAPQYAGYVITIGNGVTNVDYTIQSTDTTPSILAQNIAAYINGLSLPGTTAGYLGSSLIIIEVGFIFRTYYENISPATYIQNLWSTCNLWKCIQYLTNKIFCCNRGRCEEHTKEMQKERDELNRIMLLYTQFSMMNDDERWDYLPLNLGTDIQNTIFNKLNVITARCAHCCHEEHKHHHDNENNGCDECNPNPQPVVEWCQCLPPESVSIVGTNVIPIG